MIPALLRLADSQWLSVTEPSVEGAHHIKALFADFTTPFVGG